MLSSGVPWGLGPVEARSQERSSPRAVRSGATTSWADEQQPGSTNQLATKNESHLAALRVGVMRITSACGSGEWARSGGGSLLSTVWWAVSTRGAEPLLTCRIRARIEAS